MTKGEIGRLPSSTSQNALAMTVLYGEEEVCAVIRSSYHPGGLGGR